MTETFPVPEGTVDIIEDRASTFIENTHKKSFLASARAAQLRC